MAVTLAILKRARWLLLCGSIILGLVMAEATAAIWLSWTHRLPSLPRQFTEPARPGDESDRGHRRVECSGRSLRRLALRRHDRRSRTPKGDSIAPLPRRDPGGEGGHAGGDAPEARPFDQRPDALIVFSGHNEFLARFSLSTRVAYYSDEQSFWHRGAWLERAGQFSPLYRLILENLEKHRVT